MKHVHPHIVDVDLSVALAQSEHWARLHEATTRKPATHDVMKQARFERSQYQRKLVRRFIRTVFARLRLARAAMANIRQNVGIALGLKAVFLVTSVLGITGLWIAIMADTGATVLVTMNALRLLRLDPGRTD